MPNNFNHLLDESSKLEMSVAALYHLFSNIFLEDQEFWTQLCLEEKHHASIIQSQRKYFNQDLFPRKILCQNINELETMNNYLEKLIQQYKLKPPTRQEAFEISKEIEESAGEKHYQEGMEDRDPDPALKFFQELNLYDLDHVQRIEIYKRNNQI